jgi:excisionase family DNA binding protein
MSLSDIRKGDMALLRAREAAKYLNVSLVTLYRIEKEGKLTPFRTSGGHRRYSLAMLNEYLERSRRRFLPETSSTKRVQNPQEKKLADRTVRILVVDYEPHTIELITNALHEDDDAYEFASASSSYEAGVQVVAFKPALIILGKTRPATDGYEICKKIKSDPQTEHIQVLGIVGSGDNGTVEEMLRCEVDGCLIKPLQTEALQRSVWDLTHSR